LYVKHLTYFVKKRVILLPKTGRMYKKITTLALFFIALNLQGQIYDPVTWDFSYEKTGTDRYDLIFNASIEDNSHIYSLDIPENGPVPTTFSFDSSSAYVLEGKPFEVTKPEEVFDEAFGW
jgi:hypothetical protein